MAQGFTVDTNSLATRIGELRALAASVRHAAALLGNTCGNLGPGELTAAMAEVSQHWNDGLNEMQEKIDRMAGNVGTAIRNYQALEQDGQDTMKTLADQVLVNGELGTLRAAAAVQIARQHGGRP
jgi:methyl-accepting chemotaxis protein